MTCYNYYFGGNKNSQIYIYIQIKINNEIYCSWIINLWKICFPIRIIFLIKRGFTRHRIDEAVCKTIYAFFSFNF